MPNPLAWLGRQLSSNAPSWPSSLHSHMIGTISSCSAQPNSAALQQLIFKGRLFLKPLLQNEPAHQDWHTRLSGTLGLYQCGTYSTLPLLKSTAMLAAPTVSTHTTTCKSDTLQWQRHPIMQCSADLLRKWQEFNWQKWATGNRLKLFE